MKDYEFEITVKADSEEAAEKKVQLLLELSEGTSKDDLEGIVNFVIEYPNTVQLIKDELPTLKDKNTLQLVSTAAKLIKKIKEALAKDGFETED